MLWGDMGMTLAHRVPQSLQWRSQSWALVKAIEGTQRGARITLGGLRSWGTQQWSHWEGPSSSPGAFFGEGSII